MLTVDALKKMAPETVFATGVTNDPRLYKDEVRWVAIRGRIHDWAIYFHHSYWDVNYVRKSGDKVGGIAVIKDLVNCTDEALQLYRF